MNFDKIILIDITFLRIVSNYVLLQTICIENRMAFSYINSRIGKINSV